MDKEGRPSKEDFKENSREDKKGQKPQCTIIKEHLRDMKQHSAEKLRVTEQNPFS